jgi:hypothetical protein
MPTRGHYSRLDVVRTSVHDNGLVRQHAIVIDCHVPEDGITFIATNIRHWHDRIRCRALIKFADDNLADSSGA